MAQPWQSKTLWLRLFLLIFTASGAALPSAQNCTGPRTYDEYMEMTFGNGTGYGRLTRPQQARDALNKTLFADMAPPEDVQIQMNIHQVNYVHDAAQSFKIFVMESLVWFDWRLRHKGCLAKKYVNFRWDELNGTMWIPDVYVVNSADDKFLKGGCFLYLNGMVICTTYHSYVLTCSMDFKQMPFDTQHCHIEMRVFAGTAKEVNIRPTTMAKPIVLPKKRVGTVEWNVTHVDVSSDILTTDAGTEESRVFFKLTLKRESFYYVKQVLIPTVGIVWICWLSFFVSKGAVPARCAVTVIAFLTITNTINGVTKTLPRMASEVWLLVFLSGSRWFAFLTILEYGVVNILTRYEEQLTKAKAAEKKRKEDEAKLQQLEAGPSALELVQPGSDNGECAQQPNNMPSALSRSQSQSARMVRKGMTGSWQGACTSWLILKKDGNMRLKDIDVDVFARWAYPIAYGLFFLIMIGHTW